MSLEAIEGLVQNYGYWIIFAGTYFDHYGIPLFLVFGGIAASQEILDPTAVFICGFAGGWIADLFLYFLGFKTGLEYWKQFAFIRKFSKQIEMVQRLFETKPVVMVVLGRFLFAVSKFIPPFAGMIHYSPFRYVVLSFLGNVLFSCVYTTASYFLGKNIIGSLDQFKLTAICITILFILVSIWATKRLSTPSPR
jgi:membrane protein DedA with SNARE-associated domain